MLASASPRSRSGVAALLLLVPGVLVAQVDEMAAMVQADSNSAQAHYLLGLA